MDDHLSAIFEDVNRTDNKSKTPLITPRLSRPITALAIRTDILDEEASTKKNTVMPRLANSEHHPYISAKAQDLLYGGQKHEHAKIYDKLGMTAKEFDKFKNAGKLLIAMGAGHSGLSPAHSEAERIVHDELTESARARSIASAEKARKRNAASAITHASKKAQEILKGKRDKATERLGVSRNEINQFKTINKAYQRLGIYDSNNMLLPQTKTLPIPSTTRKPPQLKLNDSMTQISLIPASSSAVKSTPEGQSDKAFASEQKEQSTENGVCDRLEVPHHSSPTHSTNSDVISIGELSPASWMRSNSTFSSVPLPASQSPINVASPQRSARGSRRIVLQPIASRAIIPRVRSGIRDSATNALPGQVNSRSPSQAPTTSTSASRPAQQAWKKKAKIIGKVATAVKSSPKKSGTSTASVAAIDPLYPLLSTAARPSLTSFNSRATPLSPVPSTKAKTLTARSSWKKVDTMVKAQRAVRSLQPKTVTTTKRT